MFLIQLYKDNSLQWRWRCKAKNGKIVADSGEGYENWQDCLQMTMRLFCDNETFNFVNLEEEKLIAKPLTSTHPTSPPMYHTFVKEETDGTL